MNPWIIAPVVIPAMTGALIVVAFRNRQSWARTASILTCAALLAIAAALVGQAVSGSIQSYAVGNWRAPFGIVLVLDRLSAAMLLLTAILGAAVAVHAAASGLDRRGWHFHALLQLQLLGLNGAFLTGDLFNLFVFFEILLIASYCLLLHGGGRARLRAGVQYVVINLVGSILFLVAAGLLYGVTGTLNMADMARRIAGAPAADQGLIAAGAMTLTTVFALKAAIAPLHLWLAKTYAAASPAVAALFVIMTKVGAYSVIRTTTLMFGETAGSAAWIAGPWLLAAALATGVLGFLGVFAATGLRSFAAFTVIGSMGVLFAAISIFQPAPMGGALYYLISATLAGAGLFLLTDVIVMRRAGYGDALAPAPRFRDADLLSGVFLLIAIGVIGLPPLSGFVGKLLILGRVELAAWGGWIWAMVLGTTFIAMLAFARAGSTLFWRSTGLDDMVPTEATTSISPATWLAPMAMLACMTALTAGAGAATAYLDAAADQLFAPEAYIRAVLGAGCGVRAC